MKSGWMKRFCDFSLPAFLIMEFEKISVLHIAKLNGRICGAKRSHSVFEQPNCYQSV